MARTARLNFYARLIRFVAGRIRRSECGQWRLGVAWQKDDNDNDDDDDGIVGNGM